MPEVLYHEKLGRHVVCDDCNTNYTDRPETGGFIFGSRAICPTCAPKWIKLINKYGEGEYVRARCPEGKSFADFVREYRGPDAAVTITSF